jgi:hypothetical protein
MRRTRTHTPRIFKRAARPTVLALGFVLLLFALMLGSAHADRGRHRPVLGRWEGVSASGARLAFTVLSSADRHDEQDARAGDALAWLALPPSLAQCRA